MAIKNQIKNTSSKRASKIVCLSFCHRMFWEETHSLGKPHTLPHNQKIIWEPWNRKLLERRPMMPRKPKVQSNSGCQIFRSQRQLIGLQAGLIGISEVICLTFWLSVRQQKLWTVLWYSKILAQNCFWRTLSSRATWRKKKGSGKMEPNRSTKNLYFDLVNCEEIRSTLSHPSKYFVSFLILKENSASAERFWLYCWTRIYLYNFSWIEWVINQT